MKEQIAKAIALRGGSKPEEALEILGSLLQSMPRDPNVNYQMALTCDAIGKEADAIAYYKAALEYGLVEDRRGALLGLGSTYRCLGKYEKSLIVFDQAIVEFPDFGALKVFRSLVLYNLGRVETSFAELLIQLLDTTSDTSIKSYDRALRFYSDKLNETWR